MVLGMGRKQSNSIKDHKNGLLKIVLGEGGGGWVAGTPEPPPKEKKTLDEWGSRRWEEARIEASRKIEDFSER
jgi:hypothetical protein